MLQCVAACRGVLLQYQLWGAPLVPIVQRGGQCVAVCRSVLQSACYSVLQCVAVYCIVLQYQLWGAPLLLIVKRGGQCVAVCCSVFQFACCDVLQCVAVCCSVLQCVAVCCSQEPHCYLLWREEDSVLQCVVVCCSVSQSAFHRVLRYVAMYCSMLQCQLWGAPRLPIVRRGGQCVAVRTVSALQYVAVGCSMLQCVADNVLQCAIESMLQCVAVCCSASWEETRHEVVSEAQCVAVCCSVLQAVCCSVLQSVRCSMLQFVAVCCSPSNYHIQLSHCICNYYRGVKRHRMP